MLYNLFEDRDFVSVFAVALLAEGVDRNSNEEMSIVAKALVALLAEGVDRNQSICQNERYRGSRPPRRGYR